MPRIELIKTSCSCPSVYLASGRGESVPRELIDAGSDDGLSIRKVLGAGVLAYR